ncbi:hypothetical protein E8P82_10080 [Arthrobacter echini]|uniref:DUF7847 domain-containing protein n=1 Tax=Arthrobacter echini TaxID=1529066 RepID=A0A4S5E3M7_9MICC|nr:hypothetical protein [Arthrobacter echini]THJ65980.1 hypothetical protein E8P82_10080 [Arthrobacter echini]
MSEPDNGQPAPSPWQAPGQGWNQQVPPGGAGPAPGAPGASGAPGRFNSPVYPPAPMYQAPPKPGVIPLRPLGLGELLDGAFQACRRNPLATFGVAILLEAIVAVVVIVLFGSLGSSLDVLDTADPSTESVIGALATVGAVTSVWGIVSAAALLFLQGILVIPVSRAIVNQKTSFGQAWRLSRPRLLPLLGFGLLTFAATGIGLLLLVGIVVLAITGLGTDSALIIVPLTLGATVVLVWVSMKLVVAPAALMLEGTGPWTSIKRSWVLTRGNWWRTFGIVLLMSVIVSVISSVIATPLTFAVGLLIGFTSDPGAAPDALDSLPLLAATQAVTALFTAVGYAFQAGVTALLYVDLRIRREGFDVVLMREHESAGATPTDVIPGGTASFGHQPQDPM